MATDRYAIARNRRHRERNARIDRLAELVADGWTITAAARSMGLVQQTGLKMWREIKDGLGEQAR